MSGKVLSLPARQGGSRLPDGSAAPPAPDKVGLEALFLENLDVIDGVTRFVCRRHKVSSAETEEFTAEVKLKIVERDYEVLRRFEGRSSLRTYLTVVIGRLYLDYRNQQWGKWRPSAEARRLGPVGIRLETLMARDGLSFTEAARILIEREQVGVSEDALADIACRLPLRLRRVMVGEAALETTASEKRADESAILADRRAAALRIVLALRAALIELSDQDRLILRLRFLESFTIADIGRVLHLDSKPLYRRVESALKGLRTALVRAGVSEGDALEVLEGSGVDIRLALLDPRTITRRPRDPGSPRGSDLDTCA